MMQQCPYKICDGLCGANTCVWPGTATEEQQFKHFSSRINSNKATSSCFNTVVAVHCWSLGKTFRITPFSSHTTVTTIVPAEGTNLNFFLNLFINAHFKCMSISAILKSTVVLPPVKRNSYED
jgi:hypothetical protein